MKEMISRIAEEITSHLDKDSSSVLPTISKASFHDFSESNFHELRIFPSSMECSFIDGGNSEIFSSSSLSLQMLRIANVSFKGREKSKKHIREFLLLLRSEEDDGIQYIGKLFPMKDDISSSSTPKVYRISQEDETLKQGVNHGTLSSFAGMIRRLEELNMAKNVARGNGKNSMIVLDGSLQCTFKGEQRLMQDLMEACKENENLLMSLAKTDNMLTDSGKSVISELKRMSKGISDKMWYYHPLVRYDDPSYPADISYCKLHRSSRFVFRAEISTAFENVSLDRVFGELAITSGDPVFLGYPYGLIKADELARVTNTEISNLRTRLLNKIDVEDLESSGSAHSILDNARF